MQRRRTLWFSAGVLCVGLAICLWLSYGRGRVGGAGQQSATTPGSKVAGSSQAQAKAPKSPFLALSQHNAPGKAAGSSSSAITNRIPYRLSNTTESLTQLMRNDRGILLANALIDTGEPLNLGIPSWLRAPAQNNGSFVVQARGPVDDAFRASLQAAGATIVSYIPNNAFLVTASDAGANQLKSDPATQAVLPYEPYYKLDASLLKLAVEGDPMPVATDLRVTLFPDPASSAGAYAAFKQMGIGVGQPEPSPFGPVVTITPTSDQLAAVAQLPGVQLIEPAHARKLANDLFRVRLGISADPVTTNTNYLNLTGSNILITLADSGVNGNHPDLTGRVFGANASDTAGHGTHVAGTIAGNGTASYPPFLLSTPIGSTTNENLRGMAPLASLYSLVLPGYEAGSFGSDLGKAKEFSDGTLQAAAAQSNSLISNNSWNYDSASEYDIAAASYDAAVRDALPQVKGPQPVLFVFSAGNAGNGDDNGLSGDPESILSPATAKNVITVGAIEQPRNITNSITLPDFNTVQPFLAQTDSSNQVAGFSSRGNVGIGIEGDAGRFKPDVIAPGTMVVSDASQDWDTNAYYSPTNFSFNAHTNQAAQPGALQPFSIFIPDNAVGMTISVVTNFASPNPMPPMPIYLKEDDNPTVNTFDLLGTNSVSLPPSTLPGGDIIALRGHTIFYSVGDPTNQVVAFDAETVLVTTNLNPAVILLETNLNFQLGTPPPLYYRYESGTSMSAAGISGMLALIQQFFQQRLGVGISPALMKALVINGARSLGTPYDFQVASLINYQGWGLPAIGNSLPLALTNLTSTNDTADLAKMPLQFIDQSPTNALATGQSRTWSLNLSPAAQTVPLRVTLVWTDPPGNPTAGVKLVNNLALVVTNVVGTNVSIFFGNDIPAGATFNEAWDPGTNNPPSWDMVNNVQNVFLAPPLGSNCTITVYGLRVNVNAVTANTNAVVQDFALVMSSDVGGATFTNSLTLTNSDVVTSNILTATGTLTNGVPLLNQRVGGNSQYAPGTNGVTNQWNFYVYTNTAFLTNSFFTNVAFVTFAPPELGVPREGVNQEANPPNATRPEADIDMYVSFDPTLTNLNPAAIAGANKSVGRTGTEKVLFTNQQTAGPYYIGVRSQDQQGAQFNLVGVATDQPFNQNQGTGPYPLTILGSFPVNIPDGSPSLPGAVTIIGLTTDSSSVRRIIVTNGITHPSFSDLIGALSHGQKSAVLNNHKQFVNPSDGSETLIYDDSGEGDVLNASYPVGILRAAWPAPIYAKTSDGPGSLTTFEGDLAGDGVWQLTMVDDSLGFTGSVSNLAIVVDPNPPTNHFTVGIGANSSFDFFINVPPNATNLTINVSFNGVSQGLDMYVKRGSPASATSFDFFQVIPPGGGQMVINEFTAPPLNPGRYFVHLFNPSTLPVSVNVDYQIILDTSPPPVPGFLSAGNEPILDDAVTYSTNHLSDNKTVLSMEVGVRIDHPRVSDLALTLISPKGTRCLLAENRGGLTTNGYGSGYNVTNNLPVFTAGGPGGATNIIPTGANQGTLIISYDFFQIPDTMHVYYDGVRILDSGLVSGAGTFQVDFGPGLSSNVVVIMDENSTESLGDAWQYTLTVIEQKITYAVFTENTNETTLPIKFAPPPFGTVAIPAPVTNFTSSFETVPAGDYPFPAIVDGWSVLDTNPVKVVTVPAFAPNGSNILALHSGTITRVLPTVAGQKFTLSFLSHGRPVLNSNVVSWWKGDGNANDSADGNAGTPMNGAGYSAGLVSNAFNFNSASQQYIHLTNAPNLTPPGSFAIESWINFTNSAAQEIILGKWGDTHQSYALSVMPGDSLQFAINDAAHQGVPGFQIFTTSANVVAPNVWQHVAATYDTNTGTMAVYVNGQLVGADTATPITIFQGPSPVGIGAIDALVDPKTSFFDGAIDELAFYTNALIPYQLQDIYAAGSAGKCPESGSCLASLNVILGGNTNVITGLDAWQTNEFTFTATSNNMVLEFQPLDNGMLLDDIQLVQIPSSSLANFYLPEESLDKFAGENAEGDWKLEILDDRAGPPTSGTNTPNLVSWKMNVVFENTQPGVEPLTHAIPVTNCVPPSQVAYFSVAVPVWASYATNTLTALSGQGAQWLLNTNVLPLSGGNDFTLGPPPVNSPGVYTNLLQSAPPVSNPPLYPGQTYYLAVANTNSTPFCFTLEVDFNIITLTNMVPFTNSIQAGNVPQYYQYDVSVPGSVVAAYQLLTNSGNLFMTVSKGPPLPDTNSFAYGSQGFGPQSIVVTSNSLPVPLAPGRWYIGVFNEGATAVSNYEIMASETVTTIIPLTNSIPYTNSAVPGVDLTPFYSFNITNANTTAALFELYRLAGNADLTLDQGVLPYTPPFFASSTRLGTNFEQIVIRSNLLGTNITGIWYLGVPNNELTNVAYTIRAVVATNGLLISDVPITVGVTLNDSGGTNTVSLTWTSVEGETYDVLTNANLTTTNWGILATITNAPPYNATFTDPTPINGIPYMFYWIEQVPTP